MKDDIQKVWLLIAYVIVWALLIGLSSLLLSGCSVDKKAQRKASWLIAHDELGKYCNLLYPPKPDSIVVKDSVWRDTIPGQDVYVHDTIPCKDSIIYRDLKCPPCNPVVQHERHDSIVYRDKNPNERAAYEAQLRAKDGQIKAKDDLISKQQAKIDSMDKWRLWCIITWSLMVLGFVVRFFVIKRPI
jgi:hypothetical protein